MDSKSDMNNPSETTVGSVGRDRTTLLLSIAILLSVGLHLATLFGLDFVDVRVSAAIPPEPAELAFMDMEPLPEPELEPEPEPEVEEPEPEPEPEPEVEPEPEPEPRERPVREIEPEPEESAPAPLNEDPPEQEPEELTGFTLTGDGSFTVDGGNGQSRMDPIGNQRPRGRPDGEEGGTGTGGMGTGMGPTVVPVRNLSRRPEPPSQQSVARCLEENYPRGARRQGLSGVASVRAQIGPSGGVSNLSVRSESVSGEGFGQACIRCLRGRPWSPPLSRGGQPVSTRISYTCNFDVRR
ncbi:MAG: TonB family protein [Polyangiales bacterium]